MEWRSFKNYGVNRPGLTFEISGLESLKLKIMDWRVLSKKYGVNSPVLSFETSGLEILKI